MFKFIHAADLHLDSPLVGLDRYEGAPVERLRRATRHALENLVDLALHEEVRFVLIAGDLYDGNWKDFNTALFLRNQMSRLSKADIRVFVVSGNHDAQSRITRKLSLPSNVHRFSVKDPETIKYEYLQVAVHGRGFATQAVTDNVVPGFPLPVSGFFNIGLLHTSADGRPEHNPYAPCSVTDLKAIGYDYWALGHVHRRECLCEDPWIGFSGNTQGRHIRETGQKGCMLVTVENGRIQSAEFQCLDVVRWQLLRVDVSGIDSGEGVVEAIVKSLETLLADAEDRLLAVRLEITGACKAHEELVLDEDRWRNEIRGGITEHFDDRVWVEKIKLHTNLPVNIDDLLESGDPIGEIIRSLRTQDVQDKALEDIRKEFKEIQSKLPAECRSGIDCVDLDSAESVRKTADDAANLLFSMLVSGGEKR